MGPKSVSKKENVAKVGRPRKKKETTNKKECTTPPPQKESKRKRELNEESTVKFKKISKKAKTKSNDEDDVLTPLPPHKVTPTLKDTKDKRTSIQHTLSDFNGNDSYFNDESQFISCCFCHHKICEGENQIMCIDCGNSHVCRVNNLERSYGSPFQW